MNVAKMACPLMVLKECSLKVLVDPAALAGEVPLAGEAPLADEKPLTGDEPKFGSGVV